MKKDKNYAAALCLITLLQMGGVGLAPVLADMGRAYPQYPATMIQIVSSLPSMFVALTNLFIPAICRRFPKKYTMAAGCGIAAAFSLLGFFFHGSLPVLYVWSALLGVGTSMACTVAQATVNEMFAPKERVGVYGKMAFTASIGAMSMTFAGGFLVQRGWYFGYLVYLIALFGLSADLLVLPGDTVLYREETSAAGKRAPHNTKKLVFACAAAFFVGYLYNVAAANISMLVAELQYGDSETAGLVSTIMLLVGGLVGLFVNRISARIGYQTMTLGYLSIFVGYLLVFWGGTLPTLFLAAVIFGGAISFVMPFAQLLAAEADKAGATAGIARTVLFSSVGMLLSPLMTPVAALVTGTALVKYRFLLAACISLVCTVATFCYCKREGI